MSLFGGREGQIRAAFDSDAEARAKPGPKRIRTSHGDIAAPCYACIKRSSASLAAAMRNSGLTRADIDARMPVTDDDAESGDLLGTTHPAGPEVKRRRWR